MALDASAIGSIVAWSDTPYLPIGKLVGIDSQGYHATVDKGEFAGFPGSRYVITPLRYLSPLVETTRCLECPGWCRYGCEASDNYDPEADPRMDADFGAEGFEHTDPYPSTFVNGLEV